MQLEIYPRKNKKQKRFPNSSKESNFFDQLNEDNTPIFTGFCTSTGCPWLRTDSTVVSSKMVARQRASKSNKTETYHTRRISEAMVIQDKTRPLHVCEEIITAKRKNQNKRSVLTIHPHVNINKEMNQLRCARICHRPFPPLNESNLYLSTGRSANQLTTRPRVHSFQRSRVRSIRG